MDCTANDKYNKDGRCCDRCPPGKYRDADCTDTQRTTCKDCPNGTFTGSHNHSLRCIQCRRCDSNRGNYTKNCTAKEDTVCECKPGFYCSTEDCEHCQPLSVCPLGEGVRCPANRTSDLICAPCVKGTYSNVSDFHSPCVPHTRCEDIGRVLNTPGTSETDAVCGGLRSSCHWMLPAGLWVGLVLTIIAVAAFVLWRAKRKSYRTENPIVPVMIVPTPAVSPLEPFSHCQETCIETDCKISLFNTDDPQVICSTEHSLDSSFPITPLKSSVSFVESGHGNGSAKCNTSNFWRSYSEPQEDEWCGT